MTDMSENANLPQPAPEVEMGPPKFSQGDIVTVARGKGKGKEVTVIGERDANGAYAVRYTEGGYAVTNEVSLKAPAEASATAGQIAGVLNALIGELSGQDVAADDVLQALVTRLNEVAPGLDEKISWLA